MITTFRVVMFVLGSMLVCLAVIAQCSGCAPPTPAQEAETKYTGTLLRCVDKANTLAESKACRAQVDATFFPKDGGP